MSPEDLKQAVVAELSDKRAAMTGLLADLVNIESGSANIAGVDRVQETIRDHLASHGVDSRFEPTPGGGRCLHAGTAEDTGHVLLMGHCDTVFPDGTVAERPYREEGDIAYGPGVADMKAGLVINTFVLEAFRRAGVAPLPLRGLYTGDEEIASPRGRPVIESTAQGARAVFNSEPTMQDGKVTVERKGASFMTVEIEGRAAHSGLEPEKGVSAVAELAHKILDLHALADLSREIMVNVGVVGGGTTVNTVAPHAWGRIDVRFPDRATMDEVMAAVNGCLETVKVPGCKVRHWIDGQFLPLERTPANDGLLAVYRKAAAGLGYEIDGQRGGGSADSGFTSALGVPTVCSTGPVGANPHRPDEHCRVDTLVPRAQTMAAAICDLAASGP